MPTQNVNLSEQQLKFIRRKIRKGRYRNASDVVRAGLRLLEQHERQDKLKLEMLRRVAHDAFAELDRGEFAVLGAGGLDEFIAEVDARARASKSR